MLSFILGTAGTGKTALIDQNIGDIIKSNEKALLLVPEQFSFESERRIFNRYGEKSSLHVEVLSFTRLCNSIFREFGGLAGVAVTDTARYILMSLTVEQLQDQLQVYRKSAHNISFLDTLLAVCGEFKVAGISPEMLEEKEMNIENEKLKSKMKDLSLVYNAYQTLMEKGYTDPEDDLIRACGALENDDFFKDYHVFVDGFTTFMSGEFELLGHVITQAKSATFALATDSLVDHSHGTGIFSVVKNAASRLVKIAEENGVEIVTPTILEEPMRYKKKELAVLSKIFLRDAQGEYSEKADSISIYKAQDQYQEIQYVAASIKKLVREENLRYSDIAVVSRSPESYFRSVEMLFSKYGIPFFYDKRMDVESTPLAFGLLSALRAVGSNFDGESVLFLAKSPIMGLNLEEVALLENYCYSWQVRGQLWQSDFVNNPRGLVEEFTEKDTEILSTINNVRSELIAPLTALKKSLDQGNGYDFALGIHRFLEEVQASNNLKDYAKNMTDGEEFLAQSSHLWDSIMDILDVFGQVIGSASTKPQRLFELFRLAITSTDVGVLPQTLEQVLVGGADRIRPQQMKAVFVIGVNEGVFPAAVGETGVFSDTEREELKAAGVEISGTVLQQSMLEQFFGYFAFTLPSDFLYVSYVGSNLRGGEMLPSLFTEQVMRQFPHHKTIVMEPVDFIESIASAFTALGEHFREDSPFRATLWDFFQRSMPEATLRMDRAGRKPPHKIESRDNAVGIFGKDMNLSPSRVERFYRCPFAYFVQDGLRLQKRRRVDFSPLESGSLIHYVLQVMMQKHGGKGLAELSENQMTEEIHQIINEYVKARVEDTENLSARFIHLFGRLSSTLARLLQHLGREFMQSLYTPAAYELKINRKEGVDPLLLKTPDGSTVVVEGVVDRVDIMESGGKKYIRVVDYKSGRKRFNLHDVLYGLNLQMLLYLFTIQEHGKDELGGGIPAGVLYMPVRESYNSVERNSDPKEAQKELEKQWSMSGILLDDEETLRGMEEDLAGVFIPAKLTKGGKLDARSSLASNEEMGRISNKIKQQILQMSEELSKGFIQAVPVNDNDYPTCSYCDYREVCGYEDGDKLRQIAKMSNQEVMEILKKEEKDIE